MRGLAARIIREGAGDDSVFIAEHGFYCYLIASGTQTAVLQVMLQKATEEIIDWDFASGSEFEEAVKESLTKAGVPSGASFSSVCTRDQKLFLATQESGEAYIQRGGKTIKLLSGNKFAVGKLMDEDMFILTASSSSAALGEIGGWTAYLGGADISGHDLSGLILTTSVVQKEETHTPRRSDEEPSKPKKERKPFAPLERLKGMERRRLITLGCIAIVGALLVASLVYGLIRRVNDKRLKQIEYTKQEVTQKLEQAKDVAFLNSGRAAGLINDAKSDISDLKDKIGADSNAKEIKELNSLVADAEGAIFKKEEKQPEEFFDLGIEDSNAKGTLIARSENRAVIVDPRGSIFLLNLEKKSIEKQESGVQNAKAVALGETSVFILGSNGIVQVDEEGKAKKVIERDKDWGEIVSMASFNNNLYILDGAKGVVLKYTPTEGGYGGKSSYTKDGGPSLTGAKSVAIDSSVYVAAEGAMFKFTAGLQDGFAPQFPEGGTSITKIDTAEDVEKVYAWDKPHGLLYIISKNGSYERQIKSAALKTADDIVVTKDSAYILQGQKIFKIGTD